MEIGISVIISTYNSEYEQIVLSIDSVLTQSFRDYEIIIADDGSQVSFMSRIEKYLQEKNAPSILLLEQTKNVGTVKNCISALERSRGLYVQLLGAGDTLYDRDSLLKTFRFMESQKCMFAFGRIVGYHMENYQAVKDGIIEHPKAWGFYQEHLNGFQRLIQKMSIVLRYEAIPALAMFGRREEFLKEFKKLEGRVIYCEDLFQISVYLQGKRFYYCDKIIKQYELGVGISSSNDVGFNRLLEQDVKNMYVLYRELYSDSAINRILLYACEKSPYLKKIMESFLDFVYKHWHY